MTKRRMVRSAASVFLSLALLVNGVLPGTSFSGMAYAENDVTTKTITPGTDEARTGSGQMAISLKIKKTPTASDFVFTAPENLVYDGTAKEAGVATAEGVSGMGDFTVEYYHGDTKLDSAPVAEGTYTVKVNVTSESDDYKTATGITDDSWTFTIAPLTKQMTITLVIHGHDFAYSADGAKLTATCKSTQGTCDLTDKKVSLTLKAPAKKLDSDSFSPEASFDADELAAFNTATGLDLSADSIQYYAGETQLDAAPAQKGDYTAKLTVGTGDHAATASVDYSIGTTTKTGSMAITLVIKKTPAASDFDVTLPANLAYDGNAKAVTAAAKSGITGMGETSVEYYSGDTKLTEAPKNAGTYTFKLNVAEGTDYKAAEGVTDAGWTFTITKGTPVVTAPTAKTGLAYNGSAQTPANAGSAKGGTMYYALGTDGTTAPEFDGTSESAGKKWSTSIPAATNAGTCYVWYKAVGDANHNDTEPKCVEATIAQKSLTDAMLVLDTASYVHDGTAKTPTFAVKDGEATLKEGQDYTVDADSTTSTAAYGTHTIQISGTGNYTGKAKAQWNITDNTAPTVSIAIEEIDRTYNNFFSPIAFRFFNKEKKATVTANDNESGLKNIRYAITDREAQTLDALKELKADQWKETTNGVSVPFNPDGTYVLYVKAEDNEGNITYANSDGLVIDTVKPVITGIEDGKTYNNAVEWNAQDTNLAAVTVTAVKTGETDAQVQSIPANEGQTTISQAAADLGTYTVEAADRAGNTAKAAFTITPVAADIKAEPKTITYDSAPYDVSQLFTFGDGVGTKTYTVTGGTGFGTLSGSDLTISQAGTFIISVTTAPNGYTARGTALATLTVRKAQGTAALTIENVTYGTPVSPQPSSTTNADKDYTITYKTADGTQLQTAPTDAGTYTATVTYEANDLYEAASASTTFTIGKNVMNVTADAVTVTYDGSTHGITVNGVPEGAQVKYGTMADSYTFGASPSYKDAGTYTIYYRVTDKNHEDLTGSAVITINKKDITISGIKAKDKTYDGTTAAELVCDDVVFGGILEGDTLTISAEGAFADAEAGEAKTVTITNLTLGGESAANYVLAEAGQQTTATADITAKAGEITTEIEKKEDVPEMAVEGLTEEVAETLLTEEEKEEVAKGADVNVYLDVEKLSEEEVLAEDKEKVEEVLNEIDKEIGNGSGESAKASVGLYLDISLFKKVGNNAPAKIEDTNGRKCTISVNVPEELISTDESMIRTFFIIRIHNHISEILAKTTNRNITFATDKFSTYALVYTDVPKEAEPSTAPSQEPSTVPSAAPSEEPSTVPSTIPSRKPSAAPTTVPSQEPSVKLTTVPTESPAYEITFDDNNGCLTKFALAADGRIIKPADPAREGYTFLGWYNGDKLWNFDTDIATGDITLTAKWQKNEEPTATSGTQPTVTPSTTPTATPTPAVSATAKTGDNAAPIVWLWVLTLSGGLVIVTVAGRKKKKEAKGE